MVRVVSDSGVFKGLSLDFIREHAPQHVELRPGAVETLGWLLDSGVNLAVGEFWMLVVDAGLAPRLGGEPRSG